MRRTLVLIMTLTMAALLTGCGRSDTANANNGNVDEGTAGQTVSNSNMAPTGGPGPEPENAGSVGKSSSSENKTDQTTNSKPANSKKTEGKKQ
ncbi:MAG TPA: hypothetical protein VF735_17370 [Pyrinomonadaceae bacterium]|jgi:hypothetical protein